jgi:hypothetical protein
LSLGEPGLIIDLPGVHFLDGAGLTAMVGAVRPAQDHPTGVAGAVPAGTLGTCLTKASTALANVRGARLRRDEPVRKGAADDKSG